MRQYNDKFIYTPSRSAQNHHPPDNVRRAEAVSYTHLYGIPNYRLPKDRLAEDIQNILATGVETKMNTCIGDGDGEISFKMLKENYDAVYVSIGAHTDKKLGIPGEDAKGVISAIQMLRDIGDGNPPDFTGKNVIVVGGGNVAMDATRSAIRLGAKNVSVMYRRRKADMTALMDEIDVYKRQVVFVSYVPPAL